MLFATVNLSFFLKDSCLPIQPPWGEGVSALQHVTLGGTRFRPSRYSSVGVCQANTSLEPALKEKAREPSTLFVTPCGHPHPQTVPSGTAGRLASARAMFRWNRTAQAPLCVASSRHACEPSPTCPAAGGRAPWGHQEPCCPVTAVRTSWWARGNASGRCVPRVAL